MMEALRQYALTLFCTALVCGVIAQLVPGETMGSLLRLVCGAVLLSALIAPVYRMEIPDLKDFFSEFSLSGEAAAQAGADMAEEERLLLIKEGLEAYVLERAAATGCTLTADISLNGDGYPGSIQLAGAVSEDQRRILGGIIAKDLGIPEENQQWTVENPKNW